MFVHEIGGHEFDEYENEGQI